MAIDSLVPSRNWCSDEDALVWCPGVDLGDGDPTWVPAAAVFYPYPRPPLPFNPSTTGLAAGPTLSSAITSALLECIERDAYTRAVALATIGRGSQCPPIVLDRLAPPVPQWIETLGRRGLEILVRDITGDTGIPAALCTISEGQWAHYGCAADFNGTLAVTRAIGEALQSRLVDIQGAREDLPTHRRAPHPWFTAAEREDPVQPRGAMSMDHQAVLERLRDAGCSTITVVDLSRPGFPLRVVRTVVAGLEWWARHPDRSGPRLERWLCRP